MTDLDDVRHLSTGYAAAVDALDGDAFAHLFTTDGELWVPDVTRAASRPSAGREPISCEGSHPVWPAITPRATGSVPPRMSCGPARRSAR